MRLFRDRYVSIERCRTWLLAVNAALTVVVIGYASEAWGLVWSGQQVGDALAVLGWAAIACFFGPLLGALRRLQRWNEVLGRSLLLAGLSVVSAFVGFELLINLTDDDVRFPHTIGLIMVTWVGALFSSWPSWYRVQEVLLAGTLLLGVVQRNSRPVSAIATFIVLYALSAALRNLIHTVYVDIRKPRVNLQNARMAALLGGGLFAGMFVALFAIFSVIVPYYPPSAEGGGTEVIFWSLDPVRTTPAQPGGSDPMLVPSPPRDDVIPPEATTSVGYRSEVTLSDMGPSRDDPTIVARIRFRQSQSGWRPQLADLWRVESFRTPQRGAASWRREDDLGPVFAVPENAYLPVSYQYPRSSREVCQVEILVSGFPTFVSPYYPSAFRLRSSELRAFQRSSTGDLYVPTGGSIPAGFEYQLEVHPAAHAPPPMSTPPVPHDDPLYLLVPPASETGVDLQELARRIFVGGGTIDDRIDQLRAFFREHFVYDLQTTWRTEGSPLAVFLLEERQGDCNFFATSAALLLRAAGVPTRVTAGFSRAEWASVQRCYVLRQQYAHAWIEVYRPDLGWTPIDPSRWGVSPDESTPPGDELGNSDGARGGDEQEGPEFWPAQRTTGPEVGEVGRDPRDPDESAGDRSPDDDGSKSGRTAQRGQPVSPGGRENGDGSEPASGDSVTGSTDDAKDDASDGPERSGSGGSRPGEGSGRPTRIGSAGSTFTIFSGLDRSTASGGADDADDAGKANDDRDEEDDADAVEDESTGWNRWFLALVVAVAAAFAFWLQLRPEPELEAKAPDRAIVRDLGVDAAFPADFEPRTPQEAVVFEYQRLQADLAAARRQRRLSETPREHGVRLAEQRDTLERAFARLHEVLYQVLYGSGEVSGADLDEVRACCRALRRGLLG